MCESSNLGWQFKSVKDATTPLPPLKKNKHIPWKQGPFQKERMVFQPSFFSGYVMLRGKHPSENPSSRFLTMKLWNCGVFNPTRPKDFGKLSPRNGYFARWYVRSWNVLLVSPVQCMHVFETTCCLSSCFPLFFPWVFHKLFCCLICFSKRLRFCNYKSHDPPGNRTT